MSLLRRACPLWFVLLLLRVSGAAATGGAPTMAPTSMPTSAPTAAPGATAVPTEAPTEAPTAAPTEAPTDAPSSAPTPAPPPTPAPTLAEGEVAKIKVVMTIQNVDYTALAASETLLANFTSELQESFAAAAGPNITADMVEIYLSAGSVAVEAFVTAPEGVQPTELEDNIQTSSSTLQTDIVTRLNSVPDMSTVISGTLAVTAPALEVVVMVPTAAPTPVPTYPTTYHIVTQGSCGDEGMTTIIEQAECELAATELGLRDITVANNGCQPSVICDERPPGCIYARNYWLQLNPSTAALGNDCGIKHGPNNATYDCVCRANFAPTALPTPAPTEFVNDSTTTATTAVPQANGAHGRDGSRQAISVALLTLAVGLRAA